MFSVQAVLFACVIRSQSVKSEIWVKDGISTHKDLTKEQVIQFLKENSLDELIEDFKGKPAFSDFSTIHSLNADGNK